MSEPQPSADWPSDLTVERGAARQAGNTRRAVLSLLVVLAAATGIYLLRGGSWASDAVEIGLAAAGPAPSIGAAAPDFAANTLDGKTVRLSELRGRPVWINFWASWCPPCRAEQPEVEAAFHEKQGDGLVLLEVSVGEQPSAVQSYAARVGMSATFLLDPDKSIASLYRVNGLPSHFFVDRDGILRARQTGGLGRQAIIERLAPILLPAPATP